MRAPVRDHFLFCLAATLLAAHDARGEDLQTLDAATNRKVAHAKIECPANTRINMTKNQSGVLTGFRCSKSNGQVLMVGSAKDFGTVTISNGPSDLLASVQVECPAGSSAATSVVFKFMHRDISFRCGATDSSLSIEIVPPLRCDTFWAMNRHVSALSCTQ